MGVKIQITLVLVSFVSAGLGNPQFSGGFQSEDDLDFVHHVLSGNFGSDRFGGSSRRDDGFVNFLLNLYDLSKAIDGDNRNNFHNFGHPIHFGPDPVILPPHLFEWQGQIPVSHDPFPFSGAHVDPALIHQGSDQGAFLSHLPVHDAGIQQYPIDPSFSVSVSHDPFPNNKLGASVNPASVPQWSDQGAFLGHLPVHDAGIQQYPIDPSFSVSVSHDPFPNNNLGASVNPASVPQWSDQGAFLGHLPVHDAGIQQYPIDPSFSVPVIDGQTLPGVPYEAQLPNVAGTDHSTPGQPAEDGFPIAEPVSNPIDVQASDPEPKLEPENFEEPGHSEQP